MRKMKEKKRVMTDKKVTDEDMLNEVRDMLMYAMIHESRRVKIYFALDDVCRKLFQNATHPAVSGLKIPNFIASSRDAVELKEMFETLKFHVDCVLEDVKKRQQKVDI